MPCHARLLLCLMFVPVIAIAPATAAGQTLLIVEPDVEIVAGDRASVLPSAVRSDAFVHRWPAAAAQALQTGAPTRAWTPPDDADATMVQVLGLQDAVARALLESDVRPRALSIGRDAARIGEATGATHALFARLRAAPRRGTAVAMLVDLRTGEVVRHRALHGINGGPDGTAFADGVARELLAGWRDLPAFAAIDAAGAAGDAVAAPRSDIARAAARLEARLRRHPLREDDPALVAAVRAVGCRVDAAACTSLRPIVLRDPTPYAAMLPGGALVLHSGLLLQLPDEAALAFVLAHEWAHERHGDAQARLQEGPAGRRGETARAREAAADSDAFRRIGAVGYDPGAVVELWERLRTDPAAGALDRAGSHPPTAERLAAAREVARAAKGGERGAERWGALLATRRARWQAATADRDLAPTRPAPAAAGKPERTRTVRVFGWRLPTALRWRQRPGIGAVEWTVDGTPLNRLVVVSGVPPGRPLLPGDANSPGWKATEGHHATTASLVAALRHAGWFDVRATGMRAHDFGGLPGARADLTLADEVGLRYRGTLAQVVRDGRLTWAAWVAPERYYHARDAADVSGMLDGMRFGR